MDSLQIKQFIQRAIAEDVSNGDHTSMATIPKNTQGKAQLIIKDEGIIAGVQIAEKIFNEVDKTLKIEIFKSDGQQVKYGDIALKVSGSVHSILIAERLILNTMQRMSGIATTTHKIVKLIKHTHAKILDTRKTTPNFRYFEKLAVQIGGGKNHRFGLFDLILIKDNHIDYAGGIAKALNAVHIYLQSHTLLPIVIEVRNLSELKEVIHIGGINRVLLDNFSFDMLKNAVKLIDEKFDCEASGNITLENVIEYANCGVNYISMGALTHSIKSLDMSLKAIK